jgi:hypothetical protein
MSGWDIWPSLSTTGMSDTASLEQILAAIGVIVVFALGFIGGQQR